MSPTHGPDVPVLAVVLLLLGSVLSLLLLAVVLVLATDRLRVTVERLLAVRSSVEPALEALQADVAEAREGIARVQGARRRPDGR